MKLDHNHEPHLAAEELAVPAGAEWRPRGSGWWMLWIEAGAGYCRQALSTISLEVGSSLCLSSAWSGHIRASQLGALSGRSVRVDPARLSGLISLSEQEFFARASLDNELAVRIFSPNDPRAIAANGLFVNAKSDLAFRLEALRLFINSFQIELPSPNHKPAQGMEDATERLRQLLGQIPSSDLLHLRLDDLVHRVRCTPRHLSRIFREVVGVSFRQKQTELRLDRAVELLARTDSKVVDVALESGFASPSLFNVFFKRRFRMGPREWRLKNNQEGALRKTSRSGTVKLAA